MSTELFYEQSLTKTLSVFYSRQINITSNMVNFNLLLHWQLKIPINLSYYIWK